jgi:hypothetical protein
MPVSALPRDGPVLGHAVTSLGVLLPVLHGCHVPAASRIVATLRFLSWARRHGGLVTFYLSALLLRAANMVMDRSGACPAISATALKRESVSIDGTALPLRAAGPPAQH